MKKKTAAVIKELNKNLVHKEDSVRLSLLAVIAGENIFFHGKSGTVRNLAVHRISKAFKEKPECLAYCLSKDTQSLELKEKEEKLSASSFVFLEGLWNTGSRTMNEIMEFLDSRKTVIFGADTVLPDSKDFDSLWDRFTLKVKVNETGDFSAFMDMVQAKANYEINLPDGILFTEKNISFIRTQSQRIQVSAEIQNCIFEIRHKLYKHGKTLSDQKWQSIFNLLRTSAYLSGHDTINLMDLQIIQYCIWDKTLSFETAKEIIESAVQNNGFEIPEAVTETEQIQKGINDILKIRPQKKENALEVINHDGLKFFSFNSEDTGKTYHFIRNPSGYDDSDYSLFWNEDFSKSFFAYINLFDIDKGIVLWTPASSSEEKCGKLFKKENFISFDSEIEEACNRVSAEIVKAENNCRTYISEKTENFRENIFSEESFISVIQAKASGSLSVLHELKISLDKIKESYGK